MTVYEDECCDCGLPCIGDACKYKNVPHLYCDECGDEAALYEFDGRELCIRCIEHMLIPVKPGEFVGGL